ncbi:hypothetical protein jhhlp_008320 [Lomentospora prolificans]|uniref:MalT-like TPR region domain-containing protein n=1 Tax=Lomentospora prolificans TaxID=41688 RepID=A0A2N3MXQ7_9PEZI|nr:hypothetical protein jhhlp_008320 [Lomentospora prolificans]
MYPRNSVFSAARLGRPDEAEEMMARCRSLSGRAGLTDEAFLATENPRYSGIMVVIWLKHGRTRHALRLATKALSFQRKLLGDRLKTCDSLYGVAWMLLQEGHLSF